MNAKAWPKFYEYNTHLGDGTVLTPGSNIVTFLDEKSGNATQDLETVISAQGAAAYTMDYTLGDWSATAKADAKQEECDIKNIDPKGIYLVKDPETTNVILYTGADMQKEGLKEGYLVRKANDRGGFGEEVEVKDTTTGVETISDERLSISGKIIRNGQLIILRDGKIYNAQGVIVK
jgi:hypothetical protein